MPFTFAKGIACDSPICHDGPSVAVSDLGGTMARFNTHKQAQPKPQGATRTTGATLATGEAGVGFVRDAKSELFLLACSNMLNNTFYETAKERDQRFEQLARAVTIYDLDWMQRFIPWLRNKANMRTASLVLAMESSHALLQAKRPGGRQLINSALQRADEPGEALAYWIGKYGRKLPMPVKRGIADAADRLYTQRSTLKYDTGSHAMRFGDVLELCHAASHGTVEQDKLFRYLVTRGKRREDVRIPQVLDMIHRNAALRTAVSQGNLGLLLEPATLSLAGMNWEDVIPFLGKGLNAKAAWEALIPGMGYMALLRNLRNLEQAGISGKMIDVVIARLTDPTEVAKSRQLPMRFLSAYRNVVSDRYRPAIGDALELSLSTIPTFAGHTLVLIDVSGSMDTSMSDKSQLTCHDAAVIFGLAMARRCETADVVAFDHSSRQFPLVQGESLLRAIDRWDKGYFTRGGTATRLAMQKHYRGHDRVIVVTDEQHSWGGPTGVFDGIVPQEKMALTFNLGGYKAAHAPSSPTRVTIGGLSDQAFTLLHALDSRASGGWPF